MHKWDFLNKGSIDLCGPILNCVQKYEAANINSESTKWINAEKPIGEMYLKSIEIMNSSFKFSNNFLNSDDVIIRMKVCTTKEVKILKLDLI